ncbi:hypothetical protein HPS57_01145 [Prevotella sp. PINT]|nr:hypothetical protein [Palleniella intestinalis]
MTLQEEQLDLIKSILNLTDIDIVRKMKSYLVKVNTTDTDALYSPENMKVLEEALDELNAGKGHRYAINDLRAKYL